ncbi:MAG: zf-HC2 domain-containing protein [Acidobacteria bacterium]|nr:zf-HC2 domain-containing protein [Acidobacteriota bacterium]
MSEDARNLHGFSSPDPLPDPEQHPDPDRLYAYQVDELTPEEDLEIQEHLALCGHCTELLLDDQRFTAPPTQEEAGFSEFERAAGWRQLRARLDQDGFFTRGRRRWWRSRIATVAAVFVLAILGVSIYLTHQAEPERFQTLNPLNSTRGGPSEVDEVKPPVTLLLRPAETPLAEYRAEIRDLQGRLVKTSLGLRQNSRTEVELPLDRGELPRGEYLLKLQGLRNGRLEKVADYRFRIVQAE